MLTVVPQKDEEVAEVIDFREVAPLAATKDMFKGNESLARWVRGPFILYMYFTVQLKNTVMHIQELLLHLLDKQHLADACTLVL